MEILFATQNIHKIRELKEILKQFKQIDILTLHHFPNYTPPEEVGNSFEENAMIKGEHAVKALNRWVLSEDSGLVVPSLRGEPGIHSRRYSGENSTDAENRLKLLKALQNKSEFERVAYYESCFVLLSPDLLSYRKSFSGICEGIIATEMRGNQGFGYDSLFIKNDYDKTFAELGESVKNRISHRHKALKKVVLALEGLKLSHPNIY